MWNNRIIKHEKDDVVWYSVHEVFYSDSGGINAYTENPITILGETEEEVKSQLKMIMKDIEKHEVIDASTVKLEDWPEVLHNRIIGDAEDFLNDLDEAADRNRNWENEGGKNLDKLPPEGSQGGHY